MHVDFPTTYGFTKPINQILEPCVTSKQETLRRSVVVPFIPRVPRWALLRRRAADQQSRKESKSSLVGVVHFLLRHVMGGSERAKRGRNHAKRARKESAASKPPKSPSISFLAGVQCCLKAGSGTEKHLERPKARRVKSRGSPKTGSDNVWCRRRATLPPCSVLQHNWCSIDEGNACESVSVVTGMT